LFFLANYAQLTNYWLKLERESDRLKVVSIGTTEEGRPQFLGIVTSPANQRKLSHYQDIAHRLALAEGVTEAEARQLSAQGKAEVWIDGGLHADEVLGAQQLMETLYQFVSGSDDETKRILDDVIILFVHANPDGMDMCANWYMRESDPLRRTMSGRPGLYEKYAGHDDNRDFYAGNLAETRNMNTLMYRQWLPQIVYNHHQAGPAGTVMFAPPFRDPFNYNVDPLVVSGIDAVSAAMMERFLEEGGTILTIGSSTSLGNHLGLAVTNALVETNGTGGERALPREKFYVPGSLLRARVDAADPLAWGMEEYADVMFSAGSPAFKMLDGAETNGLRRVAWYDSKTPLRSGWAWGQSYLENGAAIVEAKVGKGTLVLFGPEILFRGQPHGTFRFLFNGIVEAGWNEAD
jgi:hypothetical protein